MSSLSLDFASVVFVPDVAAHFLTPRKCWSKVYAWAGVAMIDESVLYRQDATTGRHKLYFSLMEAMVS